MKTFTHGDKEEPVHVVWYKRWWMYFRGGEYTESGTALYVVPPLVQFNKDHWFRFNEGGRCFTLSIGGRNLLYRIFFYIPILKGDLEFKATLYRYDDYSCTSGEGAYNSTSPGMPVEPVGRNPYMPQSYADQLQGIGG